MREFAKLKILTNHLQRKPFLLAEFDGVRSSEAVKYVTTMEFGGGICSYDPSKGEFVMSNVMATTEIVVRIVESTVVTSIQLQLVAAQGL